MYTTRLPSPCQSYPRLRFPFSSRPSRTNFDKRTNNSSSLPYYSRLFRLTDTFTIDYAGSNAARIHFDSARHRVRVHYPSGRGDLASRQGSEQERHRQGGPPTAAPEVARAPRTQGVCCGKVGGSFLVSGTLTLYLPMMRCELCNVNYSYS